MLVVTHIDNDHIGGIIELLKENGSNENPHIIEIRNIWHNSYRHLQFDKKDALGKKEKNIFSRFISFLSLLSLFLLCIKNNEECNNLLYT